MANQTCDRADNTFGPKIRGCRDGTDFTLLFEQSVFSLLPSVCFLGCALYRYFQLVKRDKVLKCSVDGLMLAKGAAITTLGGLQIALIVLYALPGGDMTRASRPSAVVGFLVILALAVTSYQEHVRSIRPSFLLGVYLATSTLLDGSQARTLWLRGDNRAIAILFCATVVLKLITLATESTQKRHLLRDPYCRYPSDALGSIYNRSVFWWLNSLLLRGSSHPIQQQDLPPLDPKLASGTVGYRMQSAWQHCAKDSRYSLVWVALRVAYSPLLYVIFPRVCLIGFNIAQPLLIYRVISFLDDPTNDQTNFISGALTGAALLVYLGIAISTASYQHQIYRYITMIRGALLSLIYNQTLRLPASTLTDHAAATLISEDFDRIAAGIENADVVWASPIEVALAIYILYKEIGLACFAPVVIVVGCAGSAYTLSKRAKAAQQKWMDALQVRISLTSSFLANIKGIRMIGLSEASSTEIDDRRVNELGKSKKFRQNATTRMTIGVLPETIGPAAAFLAYVLITGNSNQGALSPAKAFSALSLIALLSKPVLNFMYAFPVLVASLSSYDRIQKYLMVDQDDPNSMVPCLVELNPQWNDPYTAKAPVLETIELHKPGYLNRAKHPNTLIKIMNASFAFREADSPILKQVSMDIQRGSAAILMGPVGSGKSALLLALLGELVLKAGTILRIPECGIAYCSQEPWLPNLSIRNIIRGPLDFDEAWYAEVIYACCLNTDIAGLPRQDMTVIGSKGGRLSGGQRQRISLARAIYSRKPLLLLDDITSGLDTTTEDQIAERLLGQKGICRKYRLAVIIATHKVKFKHMVETIFEVNADSSTVNIERSSERLENYVDNAIIQPHVYPGSTEPNVLEEQVVNAHEDPPDTSRQIGDSSLYLLYANEMGLAFATVVILAATSFCFFSRFPTIWLQWWSEAESRDPGRHSASYTGGYVGFGVSAAVSFFLLYWTFLVESVPRTSVRLHRRLLKAVTAAPLSSLMALDTGVILNRFSQDMSLIDMKLPGAIVQTLDGLLDAIAEGVLIAYSSPWTALTFIPLLAIFYILQKFYLRTSRQMRHLDLEAKSPLFSCILETCDGITTIRAFSWQEAFRQNSLSLIDESQKPFYLMYSIQCWLTLVLNLLVMGIVVVLVALAVELRNTSGGALGVALNNVSAISATLAYLIQAWTSLETSLGALARLKSFESETPSEHLSRERHSPGSLWPPRGRIQFIDVTASYGTDFQPVIHDISIEIPPGTKVGICGRSGSGKSSLLASLLRLNEITNGSIFIDDLDVSRIPRDTIRRQLAVLPQDPLILSGSVRRNLDPFQRHTDENIKSVLSQVGMLDSLLPPGSGLGSPMKKDTLSSGQQQLIAFARTLLNPSPILLLDEATSMVDMQTEATIMNLVRERFQYRTVIAVAHRLNTIVDFDLILVMDQGTIVESGTPAELLHKGEGWFKELWAKQIHGGPQHLNQGA
ncbi:P-loop containing nucleoside triphosphate hydrolase protein [Aspergillus bertholletiae]|uniref:P-loop containing nucleoside triphosphate hydrolase protein n=1 Tax=Aspergillus bertholletiae TaxID=1226010 RepID=A0A5N7BF60_9EURO|nr:P-loop containing nucleoside triphosphate hydrolase protein [Aspergillus bertholletiae]